MTKQKTSSKKQSFVIAILAVLLVGLLAFNITYAFFTDRETNTDNFTFGTISLESTGANVIDVERQGSTIDTPVMPGDKLKGVFGLKLTTGSEEAFIRYKLTANAEYDQPFDDETQFKTFKSGQLEAQYVVVAYIDGELVQAAVDSEAGVTVFDGTDTGTTLDAEADKALIDSIKAYDTFATFTEGEFTYTITFERVESDTTYIETKVNVVDNVDGNGDANWTWSTEGDTANVEDLLIKTKNSFDDKVAIDKAVDDLNNALGANKDADAIPDGFTAPGDGYVYKDVALASTAVAETVAIEYTLPLELGNALQGVEINLDLIVEAVQAANVDSVIPAEDIKDDYWTAFDGLGLSDSESAYDAIVMFYAAASSHGGILEN